MKKYHFGEKLQSRDLVLRKTAIIAREDRAVSNKAVFVKYCRDFKVLREILKGMSNITLQPMFSIDGDYNNLNNLRNSKNTLL